MLGFIQSKDAQDLAKVFFLMIIAWMMYALMNTTILAPILLVAGIAASTVVGLKFYIFLYPKKEKNDEYEYHDDKRDMY